jgi:putative transposase
MPYYARKHQLGGSLTYHIFNRSNAKVPIFNTKADYRHFIKLLSEYGIEFKIKIYHWVVMPNHYHLLLEIAEPEKISKLMAGISRAYTHYHHKAYLSAGFLWQGRFKSQPIQKERYLITCGRYIERNPVKAGLVAQAQDYPYSSAKFYCLGQIDGITTHDLAFLEFGKEIAQRQLRYKEFLRDFNDEEEKNFADDIETPRGDKEFIKKLIKNHGRYMPRRKGRTP